MDKISVRKSKFAISGLQDMVDYIKKNSDYPIDKIVEIGSYVGDSTEVFAKNFEQVFAIDAWENNYDDNDLSSYNYPMYIIESQFDQLRIKYNNIRKMKMKSEEGLKYFEDNSLSIVYIDANHQYLPFKQDLISWIKKIKKGGWITFHDYNSKHHTGIKKAVLEILGEPDMVFKDSSGIKRIV